MSTDATLCSLRKMIHAMDHLDDDQPFRWFQDSYVAQDGSVHASTTYLVTMGQARRELGLALKSRST